MAQTQTTIYGNSAVVSITTAWTKVSLIPRSALTDGGTAPVLDAITIVGTPTNAPTTITYQLTYDSAGQDIASGTAVLTLETVPGGTLTGSAQALGSGCYWDKIGRTAPRHSTVEVLTGLFVWAKTDVATSTLSIAQYTGLSLSLRGGV